MLRQLQQQPVLVRQDAQILVLLVLAPAPTVCGCRHCGWSSSSSSSIGGLCSLPLSWWGLLCSRRRRARDL